MHKNVAEWSEDVDKKNHDIEAQGISQIFKARQIQILDAHKPEISFKLDTKGLLGRRGGEREGDFFFSFYFFEKKEGEKAGVR